MTNSVLPAWGALESALAAIPRPCAVALAARGVARIEPLVAAAADVYGPEALEWLHAVRAVRTASEVFAQGQAISRFTLDLAAEMARGTANSAANIARLLGASHESEQAELVFAAAAFLADTARTSTPTRSASFAFRALRAANATGKIEQSIWDRDWQLLMNHASHPESAAFDPGDAGPLGPLWPEGEPEWWQSGLARWRAAVGNFPVILKVGQ